MKSKFYFLGMVILTFSIISCQKSADQIASSPLKSPAVQMIKSRDMVSNEGLWAKLLPYVIEPRYTHFGDPDSKLLLGDTPVFFFPISELIRTDTYSGTLTLSDASNGDILGVYDLVPGYDPSALNYHIPPEIKNGNALFLFTQAEMGDNYVRKVVTMSANIRLVTGESVTLELPNAFLVN